MDVAPATDATDLEIAFSSNGGSSYSSSSVHYWAHMGLDSSGTAANSAGAAQTTMRVNAGSNLSSDTEEAGTWEVKLFNPNSANYKKILVSGSYEDDAGNTVTQSGGGHVNASSIIDAVRFKMTSGSIESGEIIVYGILAD